MTMISGMRIIDGHVHTFESDEVAQKVITAFNELYEITFQNPGTGSITNVLENMERNAIDYTVMVNFGSEKLLETINTFTLNIAKKHPNLLPFVSVHPVFEENNCIRLKHYMDQGAKGIKIHSMAQRFSPTDSRLEPLYSYCNHLQFPIVFHCGRVSNARLNAFADLTAIAPVIEKYPNIPIILTHMVDGNKEDVKYCAKTYPNVFFDTSIVITGSEDLLKHNIPSWRDDEEVVEMIREISPSRVLFGSDYPWGNPQCDIQRILSLELTDTEKQMILGDNMAKLLNM